MPIFNTASEFEKVVRQLRNTSVFRRASRYDLARLLKMATLKTANVGDAICTADTSPNPPQATNFFFLLTGDYALDGGLRLLGPRDGIVGIDDVLAHRERTTTVNAASKGTYLEFQVTDFEALRASSAAFRQALQPLSDLSGGTSLLVPPSETSTRGSIVQFVTDIPYFPLPLVIELLARQAATDFADSVIVLRPCPPGQPPSPSPVQITVSGLGALFYAYVDPMNPSTAVQYTATHDYVMLDNVASSSVDVVINMKFGHADQYIPPPTVGQPRVLQTIIIGQPPLPCSTTLHYVNANPMGNTNSSSCRLRLDVPQLQALAAAWNPWMPAVTIDADLAREMGVWARALTHRRTGIALAGGGVWSMQSVYIISELNKQGVPLDVVTGASAGALVGGYYAARGLQGLELLVKRGDSGVLDLVSNLWMFSPCVAQAFFDREFGANCCLENLTVDFRPSATNLSLGQGVAFTCGPVATAVRASASAPPFMPSTFNNAEQFVDGAFSNNVAVQVLPYFGANLTFSANTYPPSSRNKPTWMPQFLFQAMDKGPFNRMLDFTIALNLLANLVGKIEGGYADVQYNATTSFSYPFLLTTNFRLASKMVQYASQDTAVNDAINQFVAQWEHLRRRGVRTWTMDPT